jgi:hypothetical protein
MKALSVRQPWAWMIMHAGKPLENRTWQRSMRGRVLIHAAKGMTRDEYEAGRQTLLRIHDGQIDLPPMAELELGGFVGSVHLSGCVSSHPSPSCRGGRAHRRFAPMHPHA